MYISYIYIGIYKQLVNHIVHTTSLYRSYWIQYIPIITVACKNHGESWLHEDHRTMTASRGGLRQPELCTRGGSMAGKESSLNAIKRGKRRR